VRHRPRDRRREDPRLPRTLDWPMLPVMDGTLTFKRLEFGAFASLGFLITLLRAIISYIETLVLPHLSEFSPIFYTFLGS
jgi:hypothetical protein